MSAAGAGPGGKPIPVSEWLDLMLGEIDRKNAEARSAAEERARREQGGKDREGGEIS